MGYGGIREKKIKLQKIGSQKNGRLVEFLSRLVQEGMFQKNSNARKEKHLSKTNR